MTYIRKPKAHHPKLPRNALGLTRRDYEGSISTLCAGCGHDSISGAIIEACFRMNLPAHQLVKLSGIGCSSKTPTYFLGKSHGFNSVHGRMPSMATGANLANGELVYMGVSGDGDTASIGLGQFCHGVRRQINMLYIVENNGTYGLTKGQFSATNDLDSPSRYGEPNQFEAIDLAAMAISLKAGFVARSFSGDREQLVELIEAGMRYKGFAFIDIISPCVTFNNHVASTKSFDYVREHNEAVSSLELIDAVEEKEPIEVEYEAGTDAKVELHDGSLVHLSKLPKDAKPPTDIASALSHLQKSKESGVIPTGLLYINPEEKDLHEIFNTDSRPFNSMEQADLVPDRKSLEKVNASLR